MNEKHVWLSACVLMAGVYLATVPRFWQCEGVDEIDYLSLAHSLAIGKGYTIYGRPHVLYPPFFASALSVLMRLAGTGAWRLMYSFNAAVGIMGLIAMGSWLRSQFGVTGRWASWFLLFAYYPWSFCCRFLMSEPIFLPISFALLILVWRILERNTGTRLEYAAVGLLSLLAAMTRAAAVSLNVAITCAGLTRWLMTRRRAGLLVAGLALGLGVGFFAYWSVRADLVSPNAPESHWRWAKKYLGISKETQGIIAQGEEITETSEVFYRRVLFAARRYGQFVTSVVRPPDGFLPVGVGLGLLFAAGLGQHWVSRPWSPLAWYCAIFLAMILKTTWLSNYLRFYVVLSPLLFLFLAEGVRWLGEKSNADERFCRAVRLALAALSVWGLCAAALSGVGGESERGVVLYQTVWRGVLVVMWGVVAAAAIGLATARGRRRLAAVFPMALTVVWLASAVHSLALIGLRAREGWKNATLRFRRLDGVAECAQWIRRTGCGSGLRVSSLPQVPSFLSGCVFEPPTYEAAGSLHLAGVERVLVLGQLHEVPFFRRSDEERLAAAVRRAEQEGRLVIEHECGQTVLYRVSEDPAFAP